MAERYWLETLGCPKNQVDSDKLAGVLALEGWEPAGSVEQADLVLVNTCAFIESARQESIDTLLALAERRRPGARLVATGCMAERYGPELAGALPELDAVAGFGVPVTLGRRPGQVTGSEPQPASLAAPLPTLDLLNLPRPPSAAPWAYVKVAEGCDRACGFCAIPSFRGKQRSRSVASIYEEVEALGVSEIVLVAQDLASYGRDDGRRGAIHELVAGVAERVARTRLLYLYPSELTDRLVDTVLATGVAYFDLSLQHVPRPLVRRMRRYGEGARFLERIAAIRRREPDAAFRSSFIVGYPGETEEDHDALLAFVEEAELDWAGFFSYSEEEGTYAAGLDRKVAPGLVRDRLAEVGELQDRITAARRAALIGRRVEVLVDRRGEGRTHREAPEIDGVVQVPGHLPVGALVTVDVVSACGPDLEAVPATGAAA